MMFFIEMYTLRRAWNGLTDGELMWEPAEGAWSVHPVTESRTATPFITGPLAADFDAGLATAAAEGKAIEPLTSIAWLFWHVGSQPERAAQLDIFDGAHSAASGWTSPYIAAHPIFTTADEAVTAMRTGWRGTGHGPSVGDRRTARASHPLLGLRPTGTDGYRHADRWFHPERSQSPWNPDRSSPRPLPTAEGKRHDVMWKWIIVVGLIAIAKRESCYLLAVRGYSS